MLFDWFRNHRRQKLLETPFAESWLAALPTWVPVSVRLPEEVRRHWLDLVQVFVAEKNWQGGGGLEINDEIRVTVAGYACLLILGLPHLLYENVETIIVYPSTVLAPVRPPGFFEQSLVPVPSEGRALLGEAHLRGPVILVWDAVCRGRHPQCGHNVVLHEFAHKLDMLDGRADGAPPLHDKSDYARYAEVCHKEFATLQHAAESGTRTFLDQYGATNEAEFFAVATEFFFEKPERMKKKHPELFDVLAHFYLVDPGNW